MIKMTPPPLPRRSPPTKTKKKTRKAINLNSPPTKTRKKTRKAINLNKKERGKKRKNQHLGKKRRKRTTTKKKKKGERRRKARARKTMKKKIQKQPWQPVLFSPQEPSVLTERYMVRLDWYNLPEKLANAGKRLIQ